MFDPKLSFAKGIDMIAGICHEANRTYCVFIGDTSQPHYVNAPEWQVESAMKGVALHISGEHGPEASHEAWRTAKIADGWVYGATKDPEKKEHPCMVDFKDLPPEQQMKDHLFRAIVHAFKNFETAAGAAQQSQGGTMATKKMINKKAKGVKAKAKKVTAKKKTTKR